MKQLRSENDYQYRLTLEQRFRADNSERESVSIRDRVDGDLGAIPVEAAIEKFQTEVAHKTVRKTYSGTT